jgi:sensor domain CHASE-containing protein
MNTLIISHVISGVIYIIMLVVINAMCTDSINHIERELVEERNLRRQIEAELEVELKKVTGLGENVEYCKQQYATQEASLLRVLNKNEMLQNLVDNGMLEPLYFVLIAINLCLLTCLSVCG